MSNGQISMATAQTATQSVPQEPSAHVAVPTDGVEQNGGGFAGMLSGIQAHAKGKSVHEDPSRIRDGKDQLVLDAAVEEPAVDLLAGLQVLPHITTSSEPVELKLEKTDVRTDSVPPDVATQMAQAAYLPPGRMPGVNIPTALPVGTPQNVVTVTELPAVIAASLVEKQVGHVAGELLSGEPPEAHSKPLPQSAAANATINVLPTVQSDRMSDVNNLTALPVDGVQNVHTPAASVQSALSSASSDKLQVKQVLAELVQMPVALSATTATVPVPEKAIVTQGKNAADVPAISAGKTAASVTIQPELPASQTATPQPASSPESELEIQLSQPRPITARVTATTRQQIVPEQQIETVRTGNEKSGGKELAPSLQTVTSAAESMAGSDTSPGRDSNQGQPGSTSDNQVLEQQMRGQLSTEHQKVAAISTKGVATEPVRQDIPEQVMQQVKDRLVQHDVKPGNQQITLTLSPENLGELKMNLNLQGQKLSVEIITENRTVRDAIVLHTAALKESLARQNITMESFDVTTGGKGSGNQGQNQNAWRELAQQQQQQQSWTAPRGYQVAQADLPSGQAYQRQQGQSMLDIHY